MVLDFFLERARIEIAADGTSYSGYVPDLPEINVKAASFDECRVKVAQAIADLLASEAENGFKLANHTTRRYMKDARLNHSDAHEQANASEDLPRMEVEKNTRGPGNRVSAFGDIIYEKRDWIARVTINRPDVYNAYTSATLKEMAEAFRDAAQDKSVAAVVLTGSGDKAFCAGSDVKQHSEEHLGQPEKAQQWIRALIDVHEALRDMGKPTVARINGIVAGGGNGLSLACDLAIAADQAKFVLMETKFGMIAANGAAQWLPLVVGERRAREMLMTGEPVSANKALLWGLVNDVVPYKELDSAIDALCQKLIDRFPQCMKFTRQQLSFWKNLSWDSTIEEVSDWLSSHFKSTEAREGLQALANRDEIDYRSFRLSANAATDSANDLRSKNVGNSSTQAHRACAGCGANELPASFAYCGMCGSQLD